MDKLSIQIKLISEMIFGSGESVPGYVDLEVLHDEYGLPYFKGKTFKGKLREEAENVAQCIEKFNRDKGLMIDKYIRSMFGTENSENSMAIKFSDCTLGKGIRENIAYGIERKMFTSQDVLDSMTSIKSFTSINEYGTALKGSLRQFRVINKGYIFICDVYSENEFDDTELCILAASSKLLRHLGTMESRGKGEVECRLIKDGSDITDEYVKMFREKVCR